MIRKRNSRRAFIDSLNEQRRVYRHRHFDACRGARRRDAAKLIHAALSFVVAFVGIAAFFFLLGAEFVGLVQVFVYVGAVAVLIVFTILLTRRDAEKIADSTGAALIIAIAVFGGLIWAILKTPSLSIAAPPIEALTVKRIGEVLMTDLRLAVAMCRAAADCRADRRAYSRDGGEAMTKMKQTLNAQRPTLNPNLKSLCDLL